MTRSGFGKAMGRRDFIKAITVSGAAWVTGAGAQQAEPVRRVGVLMHVTEKDQDGQARLAAFVGRLKELGWAEGRNLHLDIRWGPDDPSRYPRQAAELVAMKPDVLVAPTSFTLAALQRATRGVPIVFMGVIDPVGGGFVSSSCQTRRQHDRVYRFRVYDRCEVAWTAERDGAQHDTRSGSSRCVECLGNWPVRCNPGGWSRWDRFERDRYAKCQRA